MYRKVAHPFLLVIANSHESQWYRVTTANSMEELDKLIQEKAKFSDKEGHSRTSTASGGSLKTNEEWDEETRKHLESSGKKTRELWNSGKYEDLVIAAPENLKNHIAKEVNLPKVKHFYIVGNFTHANLHQKLLQKIQDM